MLTEHALQCGFKEKLTVAPSAKTLQFPTFLLRAREATQQPLRQALGGHPDAWAAPQGARTTLGTRSPGPVARDPNAPQRDAVNCPMTTPMDPCHGHPRTSALTPLHHGAKVAHTAMRHTVCASIVKFDEVSQRSPTILQLTARWTQPPTKRKTVGLR